MSSVSNMKYNDAKVSTEIDSLVDIIGVCAALNYLNPKRVYCNEPMLGKGFVHTEHGTLSVPPPAVIELIRQKNMSKVRRGASPP